MSIREIPAAAITDAVEALCIEANTRLPADVKAALDAAEAAEPWPLAKETLGLLQQNLCVAKEKDLPICQDTGMACVFIELGQDAHIDGDLTDAVNEGVRRGYEKAFLRKSITADPLQRVNTGDNTPAFLTVHLVPGSGCKITVAPKGAGSENMSRIAMLRPSDGLDGVKQFVLDAVLQAGPNPCPPIVVGVGLGGTFDKAALLAKKALLRETGGHNEDPFYAELERELLERINALGIGPQGFGGKTILPGTGDSVGGTLRIQNWYWKDASQVQGNNYDGLGALAFADIEATDARYLETADVEAGNYYQAYLYEFRVSDEDAAKLAEYGLTVDPNAVVAETGVGLQQRVEILKTLYRGAEILILDEPTAVLTPQETDELFSVIRRIVRERGMTVILITHKLYEVMAISDRVGVMRKGKLVGVEETKNVNERMLASMMVGRPVLYDQLEKTGTPGAEEIRVENLTVQDNRGLTAVDSLSLSVRAGEILGIAAIEGNGQSELLEAIAGMRPVEHGKIFVHEQDVTGKTPGEIRAAGLAHVPEDRLATGLSAEASVTENLLAGKQREPRFSGFAFCQRTSSIERYASELYQKFDIRGAGVDAKAGSMSGGNMQKVVIAREFSFDAPVLLIAQPTRGVDVGAIEFIHARILEKRNEGCAILLCSADLDEVFRLSDRVITMYEGRITGEFSAAEISREEIGYCMTGGRREEAQA